MNMSIFKLFQLPITCNFLKAFDLFFKLHKIFDLKFEPNISNVMRFVEYFIYKIQTEQPTDRMLEIFNMIE